MEKTRIFIFIELPKMEQISILPNPNRALTGTLTTNKGKQINIHP